MNVPLPFHDLRLAVRAQRADLLAAMARVLDRGRFILGPELDAFEREFAEWLGAAHVAGVASGTAALELALLAAGVGPGDLVVVPALTAAPTAMAVFSIGARPLLADVDDATATLDPAATRDAARRAPGPVKAIVPVHLHGQCAAMDDLLAVAREIGAVVVEDVAQAQGATDRGRMAGTMGAAAAFSFYPTKNLGALGDAGAVATNDAGLAARVKRLRNYGAIDGYDFAEPGRNARLDELQAAILRVRLPLLREGNRIRAEHARAYRAGLRSPHVVVPAPRPDGEHVFHQFVVRCAARERLREHLAARGIETLVHYPRALHRMAALRDHAAWTDPPQPLPRAERAAAELVSLPVHPELDAAAIAAVVAAVNAFEG